MAIASQVQPDIAHTAPIQKWLVALAVMLGTAPEVLDISIVNVALPHMQAPFPPALTKLHGFSPATL
jgi:hypothetical protein